MTGFLDKNKDLLFKNLSQAMFACERGLLRELFPEGKPLFINKATYCLQQLNTYVSSSSKIQTLSHDSNKTEIYSDGKTLSLLKLVFFIYKLQVYN